MLLARVNQLMVNFCKIRLGYIKEDFVQEKNCEEIDNKPWYYFIQFFCGDILSCDIKTSLRIFNEMKVNITAIRLWTLH